MAAIWKRVQGFWDRDALRVLAGNLALHVLVQAVAMLFMPLPYYSRLSLHDGNTYYRIAENLWAPQPVALAGYQRRILPVLLGRFLIPWNMEWSFLVAGIVAASLSAVYFFKIARRYTAHPGRLTLIYSVLPWLFFAAHHALAEPFLMLTLLAGIYYFLQERDGACTVAFALALLAKEVAIFPALAMGLLMLYRRGWQKALLFSTMLVPFLGFCLVYGLRWGDCTWCLSMEGGPSAEGLFDFRSGLYWIVHTLIYSTPRPSSANPTVARLYDVGNQAWNVIILVSTAVGAYLLWRRGPRELAFLNTVSLVPLWFFGEAQYNLSSSTGRQFLIVSLVILAYDRWASRRQWYWRAGYWAVALAMVATGVLWTFLYAKFFLFYKLFE
ncbi:MAG: hypothetical protein JW900_07765 [Anaerolineae bacterium]|nr:hypothetical protein [Anaerolineae bacterium]